MTCESYGCSKKVSVDNFDDINSQRTIEDGISWMLALNFTNVEGFKGLATVCVFA